MSQALRDEIVSRIEGRGKFHNPSEADDLNKPIGPSIYNTHTELVAMLARILLPPGRGGMGYDVEITSVRTDHDSDSALGPGGHSGGYAVDLWPINEGELENFVRALAAGANPWVRQMGLGGSARIYLGKCVTLSAEYEGPTVFEDNDTDHIHLGAVEEGTPAAENAVIKENF